MFRTSKLFCVLIGLWLVCSPIAAQTNFPLNKSVSTKKWVASHFRHGVVPPFSFVYGDKASATFLPKWNVNRTDWALADNGEWLTTATYQEPGGGLTVTCDIVCYADFDAIEWTLHFTNDGTKDSPSIHDVAAVDVTFAGRDAFQTLVTARGSDASRHDFEPVVVTMDKEQTYSFAPTGGRSSDISAFPFFQLDAGTAGGVLLAIGWSGNWKADFDATSNGSVRWRAGMKDLDLFLHPAESVRTPRISFLLRRTGDVADGQNLFRRFILAHHTRKVNGVNPTPPFCGGFSWGDPYPCSEYGCVTEDMAIAIVKRYKQFGIMPEVFWMDAGWTQEAGGPNFEGKNWYNTAGTWVIDEERYPNGFRRLTDIIHGLGAKFMVWFEPERVTNGSKFAVEHPEWMLRLPGQDLNFLYNIGNPEACDYLCQYIGDLIESNGIDYYRQDFNIAPEPYWAAADEPRRRGLTEIRHIEGLYRYWDYLLERFPEMQIDNCASGGRRLDLETTSRATPLWRTDYHFSEPLGYQNHTYNLCRFLPLHGTGFYFTDDFYARSSFSSAMVINWKVNEQTNNIRALQRTIAKYKELRGYWLDDYYPLTGDGDLTGEDVCLAYQLNRPADGSGLVMAFRRGEQAPATLQVALRGLQPDAVYKFVDDTTEQESTYLGSELAKGLTLTFPNGPSSVLLRYWQEK